MWICALGGVLPCGQRAQRWTIIAEAYYEHPHLLLVFSLYVTLFNVVVKSVSNFTSY